MVPKIASGHHGKSGPCGGLPVFGGPTEVEAVGVGPTGGVGAGGIVHVPVGAVIWLVSNVTAPFRARARPETILAPVVMVILVSAITFPSNVLPVPNVAELPTCQNTAHPWAPLVRSTTELLAVVSVLPILKMYTPLPLRVSGGPVSPAEELNV